MIQALRICSFLQQRLSNEIEQRLKVYSVFEWACNLITPQGELITLLAPNRDMVSMSIQSPNAYWKGRRKPGQQVDLLNSMLISTETVINLDSAMKVNTKLETSGDNGSTTFLSGHDILCGIYLGWTMLESE